MEIMHIPELAAGEESSLKFEEEITI